MASDPSKVKFVDKVPEEDILDSSSQAKGLVENNNFSPSSLDNRLKRKAKRPSKSLIADDSSLGNVVNVSGSYRYSKNSRRSRNRYGRGLPKKG